MSQLELVPNCERCAAVCCVATSFEASEDFAFTKPAGVRCQHLQSDDRCQIHEQLVERGCSGCAIYGCHGAGQRVTHAFAGHHDLAARDAAFLLARVIHELLWLLHGARALCPQDARALRSALEIEIDKLEAIEIGPAPCDAKLDVDSLRGSAHALLRQVGATLGGRRALRVIP